jgi:hypothetical protein
MQRRVSGDPGGGFLVDRDRLGTQVEPRREVAPRVLTKPAPSRCTGSLQASAVAKANGPARVCARFLARNHAASATLTEASPALYHCVDRQCSHFAPLRRPVRGPCANRRKSSSCSPTSHSYATPRSPPNPPATTSPGHPPVKTLHRRYAQRAWTAGPPEA